MRIIAGEFRGRNILAPESDTTRPITDRAKQSLFDILAPTIEGACVYDCFAGTGSMGLESLSRGCERAVFFERDRSAIGRLRQNIEALKVGDRSQVVTMDIFRHFAVMPKAPHPAAVVFLDPPYRFLREKPEELKRLSAVLASGHLTGDGIVVFRHDVHDALALDGMECFDRREYGDMAIEFLRPIVGTGAGAGAGAGNGTAPGQ